MLLPIHSIVDRITNSSTEIFTNYAASVQAGYDLVQEILDTFTPGLNAKDVVRIANIPDYCRLLEYIEDNREEVPEDLIKYYEESVPPSYPELGTFLNSPNKDDTFYELIGWAAKLLEDSSDYPLNYDLDISAKDPKYEGLVKKLCAFIVSPSSEAQYC